MYASLFGVLAVGPLLAQDAAPAAPAQTPAAAAPAAAPQTPAPAPAAPAANAPAELPWSMGPIDFTGVVDGYYNANFNHPASAYNQLYNFDVKANQFSLNMAKLSLSHAPDPLGFQVDFGFGRAFDIIHSGEKAPEIFRYLEQAYISLKPPKAKGFQVDFGEFVTSAGAEVIESYSNWNYSRSLLFAYAIPYYHFGVRTTIPIGKYFTGGVQVVNGWNNVEDNNSGKTVGIIGNFTTKKFTWSNNYYVGPEKDHTNTGLRNLFDTALLLTPNDNFNVYINYDYGSDKNIGPGSQIWEGIAVAGRVGFAKRFAITPRIEYFHDRDGFATGTKQTVKEFTLTGECKFAQGLVSRLEYRHDWSNVPFYDRGTAQASSTSMDTVTLAFIAFFGPKR